MGNSSSSWAHRMSRSAEDIVLDVSESSVCCIPHCRFEQSDVFSIPICDGHANAVLHDWWKMHHKSPEELEAERRATSERLTAQQEHARQMAKAQTQVYYVETRPGVVKIGYSAALVARIASYRIPLSQLLATEPGGRAVERQRHQEFAADRIGHQREEFWLSEPLQEHIRKMRAVHDTLLTGGSARGETVVIPRLSC